MKDPSPTRRLEPPTLDQFRAFVGKVVSIPKTEIEKQEAKYQKSKCRKRRVVG